MKTILELRDLHYRYPGQGFLALRGASLAVQAGTRCAVVGRNGCGKSTLFLHCNGVLKPDSGSVRLNGREVSYDRASLMELRRSVGIVFQNAEDQLFSASVEQDIGFGPLNLGLGEGEVRRRVMAAAEACEIADLLDRPVHALSSGQKTRLALAGVLAMEPEVLVVDEILGNLDPWMRNQVLAVLDRLVDEGKSVLMSTHDMAVARNWADVVVVMSEGRVVAAEEPERVLADPLLVELVCPAEARGRGTGRRGDGERDRGRAAGRVCAGGEGRLGIWRRSG